MAEEQRAFRSPKQWFLELSTGEKRGVLIALFILALLLSLYFWLFFQHGYVFEGSFLRQTAEGETAVFSGKISGTPVSLAVKNMSEAKCLVTFTKGKGEDAAQDHYTVEVLERSGERVQLKITRGNEVLFDGTGRLGGGAFMLFDEDSGGYTPILDSTYKSPNAAPAIDAQYSPPLAYIGQLALGEGVVQRGNGYGLFAGLLFIAMGVGETLFPGWLFRRRVARYVEEGAAKGPSKRYREERGCIMLIFFPMGALILLVALFAR